MLSLLWWRCILVTDIYHPIRFDLPIGWLITSSLCVPFFIQFNDRNIMHRLWFCAKNFSSRCLHYQLWISIKHTFKKERVFLFVVKRINQVECGQNSPRCHVCFRTTTTKCPVWCFEKHLFWVKTMNKLKGKIFH